jgi:hypothetical protein
MTAIALSGNDTLVLNNRTFADFADANVMELTFPNDISQVKTGKNGNSIYGLNATGLQCELKVRLIRGSSDDTFLNGLLVAQQQNFSSTVLLQGQVVKKLGDGQGNVTSDTYILGGGVFQKQVEVTSNVEGDALQSVAVYMMKFTTSPRAIT